MESRFTSKRKFTFERAWLKVRTDSSSREKNNATISKSSTKWKFPDGKPHTDSDFVRLSVTADTPYPEYCLGIYLVPFDSRNCLIKAQ